jgi:phosphomannomutase
MRSKDSTTDGWRGLPGPRWSEREILSVVLQLAASGALASTTLIGFDTRAGSRELAPQAPT